MSEGSTNSSLICPCLELPTAMLCFAGGRELAWEVSEEQLIHTDCQLLCSLPSACSECGHSSPEKKAALVLCQLNGFELHWYKR